MLGQTVTVLRAGDSYEAVALDIDEAGGLIVERPDGTRETLFSGEVGLKRGDGKT
jgi:biotin-(acetyl-CoA carboxylase) ligase